MSLLRPYRPGQHQPRPKRAGALMLVLLGLLLYAGYTRSIPFLPQGGTEVRARFSDATHLRGGSLVRVAGVDVGRVERVERLPDRGVEVTMRIDDGEDLDLRADARARVTWRTLLGRNVTVDLERGHAAAPLAGPIPLRRTEVQVEADQALQPLGRDQRRAVRDIIGAFDDGTRDARAINRTLDAAGPALRRTRTGLGALRGTRAGNLTTTVRETRRLLGALDASGERLSGLVDDAHVALGVTAARRDAIGSLLDEAPVAMDDARRTFARVRTTLDLVDPVARDLLPGARALAPAARAARPALAQLDRLLGDGESTLRDLRPAVRALAGAVPPGIETVEGLRPIVDRANADLLPWLRERDDDTGVPNATAIGAFYSAVSSAASPFDANGPMLNFQSFPDERSLLDAPCVTRLTDPDVPADQKVRCEALELLLRGLTGSGLPTTRSGR